MRRAKAKEGFTLVEMLIAVGLAALVITWTYGFLAQMLRTTGQLTTKSLAANELEDLVDDIKRQFDRRATSVVVCAAAGANGYCIPPPPVLFPDPVFNQFAPPPLPPCQQELDITQFRGNPPVAVNVKYVTRWVPLPNLAAPINGLQIHPDLNVRTGLYPVVQVSDGTTTTPYPQHGAALGICFRLVGNTLTVEAGEIYFTGNVPAITKARALLSINDHSNGITILPP